MGGVHAQLLHSRWHWDDAGGVLQRPEGELTVQEQAARSFTVCNTELRAAGRTSCWVGVNVGPSALT
jgi:hypothetical protein